MVKHRQRWGFTRGIFVTLSPFSPVLAKTIPGVSTPYSSPILPRNRFRSNNEQHYIMIVGVDTELQWSQNTLVPGHSQTKQLHRVDGTNTAMRRRLLLSDSLSTATEYADIQLLRVASIPNIFRPTSERSASLHGDNQATISFRTTDSIPCLLVLQRAHAGTSTHKFSRCVMTQLS